MCHKVGVVRVTVGNSCFTNINFLCMAVVTNYLTEFFWWPGIAHTILIGLLISYRMGRAVVSTLPHLLVYTGNDTDMDNC